MLHKLWLTFHDPALEKRYREEFNRWGVVPDKMMLLFTVALRIAILWRLWVSNVRTRDFVATLIVSLPVALEFFTRRHLERNKPVLLKDWRTTLVAASRCYMSMFFGRCIPFWLGFAARLDSAPDLIQKYPPWIWHLAASGIPLRFALTFGLPLTFADHFPLMVVMAVATVLMTKEHYCKFFIAPSMAPTGRKILELSNYIADFAWDSDMYPETNVSDPGICPCVRLLVFTNLFWGVCLASYLWWNVEFRMRVRFLRNVVGNNADVRGIVKVMSLYPWVIATFTIPVFSILWRGTGAVFTILDNIGLVKERVWQELATI